MYNVVDSFYAGKISTTALAALGLSFPIFLLIIAVSGGLSRGTSALVSNAIGQKDTTKKIGYIHQGISLGIILALILTIIGVGIAPILFTFLGASGDYLAVTLQYMNPIFYGSIFFLLMNVFNAILVANGDSKTLSKVLIVSFFLNIILDPWFLYGGFGLPALGIAGIAWATVIIQLLGTLYLLLTLLKRKFITLKLPLYKPNLNVYKEILAQAIPASTSILSVAIGFFVLNYFLKFYGEAAIAAFGVGTRIEQIGIMPCIGLYTAIMAMVGQNNGAKKIERVKETMRLANKYGLTLIVCTSVLLAIFAEPLVRLFSDDPEVIAMGVVFVWVSMTFQWAITLTSTHLNMLQALKKPMYGLYESLLRKVILPILFLVPAVFWFEADIIWVWITSGLANIIMTIITMTYSQSVLQKLKQ
jgi:putative MATE family efflux protein